MRTLLPVLAVSAVLADDLGVISPRYDCPIHDVDMDGNVLDQFFGIGSWQECGMYHIYSSLRALTAIHLIHHHKQSQKKYQTGWGHISSININHSKSVDDIE